MAALRFCCSHADPALSALLRREGHHIRVGQLPSRGEIVLWNGPARIAQAWRRRGLSVVGGNSLDSLTPVKPQPVHVGTPVDVIAWANGITTVEPHAIMMREGNATLLKPTTSEGSRAMIAPFHEALNITSHVGALSVSAVVVGERDLSPPLSMQTRLGRGVLAGWLSLLVPDTAGEQLAEFARGELDKWELQPDWPMALIVGDKVAIGQQLTFMRDELDRPEALPSAEARFEMLSALGWSVWEAQQITSEVFPTTPTGVIPNVGKPSTQGEQTQTGGFESPTHAVNPSPESPTSAGGSMSPSPSN